jgi:phosphate transport system permease protein
VIPAAKSGLLSGLMLNLARVAGETAPLVFTAFGNRFWSSGWLEPTATLPVDDLYLRRIALRRLAPPGMGCRFCTADLVLTINAAARFAVGRVGAPVK